MWEGELGGQKEMEKGRQALPPLLWWIWCSVQNVRGWDGGGLLD